MQASPNSFLADLKHNLLASNCQALSCQYLPSTLFSGLPLCTDPDLQRKLLVPMHLLKYQPLVALLLSPSISFHPAMDKSLTPFSDGRERRSSLLVSVVQSRRVSRSTFPVTALDKLRL